MHQPNLVPFRSLLRHDSRIVLVPDGGYAGVHGFGGGDPPAVLDAARQAVRNTLASATQGPIGADGKRAYNAAPMNVLRSWEATGAKEDWVHRVVGSAYDLAYQDFGVDLDDVMALEAHFPKGYDPSDVLANPWELSGKPLLMGRARTGDVFPEWSVRRVYRGVASVLPIFDDNLPAEERKQLRILGASLIRRGQTADPDYRPASFHYTLRPLVRALAGELENSKIPGAVRTSAVLRRLANTSETKVAFDPNPGQAALDLKDDIRNALSPSGWSWTTIGLLGGLGLLGVLALTARHGTTVYLTQRSNKKNK